MISKLNAFNLELKLFSKCFSMNMPLELVFEKQAVI